MLGEEDVVFTFGIRLFLNLNGFMSWCVGPYISYPYSTDTHIRDI